MMSEKTFNLIILLVPLVVAVLISGIIVNFTMPPRREIQIKMGGLTVSSDKITLLGNPCMTFTSGGETQELCGDAIITTK